MRFFPTPASRQDMGDGEPGPQSPSELDGCLHPASSAPLCWARPGSDRLPGCLLCVTVSLGVKAVGSHSRDASMLNTRAKEPAPHTSSLPGEPGWCARGYGPRDTDYKAPAQERRGDALKLQGAESRAETVGREETEVKPSLFVSFSPPRLTLPSLFWF